MEIEIHEIKDTRIAKVISEGIVIANPEDGLNLLGNVYYQDCDKIVIHEKNITQDFFDLKTGIAGKILQKFSTYRVRLAIVGDFEKFQSKSLKDFIFESNKNGQINFVGSQSEAIERLSK